ncbi:hypothetical protein RJT34_31509 [Clitoria ternatea]|uniref:Leucine-rich repeat-containing N-terminal plant-type domain-containing protein n=1 Tax=Clitoria ternatea TaxID=43366 RepID=A0AAN9EYN2_CLITE
MVCSQAKVEVSEQQTISMEKLSLVGPLFCLLLLIKCVNSTNPINVHCLASEVKALLDFKKGLPDPQNQLSSWRDNNCCQWQGIGCDNITGLVVSIDLQRSGLGNLNDELTPSLLNIKSLRHLDLSYNTFRSIPIPSFFGSLENLQYLDLSNAGFAGIIPPNIGNLSRLQFLYLESYRGPMYAENLRWVVGLVSLKQLDMKGVDLSLVGPDWLTALNKIPSLTELYLRSCQLSGYIDQSLPSLNLTSLVVLDLSYNHIVSSIPHWLANITTLQYMDISHNSLYGRIPLGFGDLLKLQYLNLRGNANLTASCSQLFRGRWEMIQEIDISSNALHGKFPSTFGNLTSLTYLDLGHNFVEGNIPSSFGKLCNLNYFCLSGNMISTLPEFLQGTGNCPSGKLLPNVSYFLMDNNLLVGKIPEWLAQLENLVQLGLDGNLLEGPIPVSLGSLQKLEYLNLRGNKLNGTLPESLGQLSELSELYLSSNKLTGMVTEAHFSKTTNLRNLDLSSNSINVDVNYNWTPPFQLYSVYMGSCPLGPSFPAWLKSQKEIAYLDLSNAGITGFIPNWFWDISSNLADFNVSHNQLQGRLPNQVVPLVVNGFLDLSFNLFEGPVPLRKGGTGLVDLSHNCFSGAIPWNISDIMPNLYFLSYSNNNLSGEIPLSIGQISSLVVFDLSRNNLRGRIPPSLANCSFLEALDLGSNNLFGIIPASLGQLHRLRSLHLSDNNFGGDLPSSLRNLSNLETMDLGNNGFSGIIPPWFDESFSHLRILNLRSNAFYGELPPNLSKLTSLQVLDIARNNLSGSIPASLGDLNGIAQVKKQNTYLVYGIFGARYYEETLVVYTKDQLLEYTKTLSLVTSIDLSDNNFTGNLPNEITKLVGLVVLNLSRNHIKGQIPQDMSTMHQLQSLDLSSNQLSGSIPSSISSLSFLGFFNLSNNNLLGAIPYTGQITTFDASSFARNPGLCGPPLLVRCQGDNDPGNDSDKGESEYDGLIDKWFYLSVGLGFAAAILVPYFILAIKRSWGDAYFDFVDQVIDKLW